MPVSIFNRNPQANIFANQGAPVTFGDTSEGSLNTSPLQNMYKNYARMAQNITKALQQAQQAQQAPAPTPAPTPAPMNQPMGTPDNPIRMSDYIKRTSTPSKQSGTCAPGLTKAGCNALAFDIMGDSTPMGDASYYNLVGEKMGPQGDKFSWIFDPSFDISKVPGGHRFNTPQNQLGTPGTYNYDINKTGLGRLGITYNPFKTGDMNVNEY